MSIPSGIARKIFYVAVIFLLAALLFQFLFTNVISQDLYYRGMLTSYENEFTQSASSFPGGSDTTTNTALKNYTQSTGSPVFVFTDNLEIADREFLRNFIDVSINTADSGVVRVLLLDPNQDLAYLNRGLLVDIQAVKIGNSNYYEPISLTGGRSHTYSSRDAFRRYQNEAGIEHVYGQGNIVRVQYASAENRQREMAFFIYNNVKDCLVLNLDPETYLTQLTGETVTDSMGTQYRFFSHSKTVNGTTYHMVTARRIFITGSERLYMSNFFYSVYLIVILLMVGAAYLLSRYLSRPLIQLSHVTEKLAALDFSEEAQINSKDELGQLANNVNIMSHNIQESLEQLRHANEELKSSTEKAQLNEERMKLLLADLAHEFKTPLGILSTHSELMEHGLYRGKEGEYFHILDDEIEKLTQMVNEVIELSKLESGNWKINIAPWDLPDLIMSILSKFTQRLKKDGYTLHVSLAEATVLADARRIEQVFENFISNALKYSDGNKQISVKVRDEKEHVIIYVGNSGRLSRQERDRIWERYYQKGSAQVRLPSAGIGLDIVKNILVSHKSDFGVIQEENMVYFYFTLKKENSGVESAE